MKIKDFIEVFSGDIDVVDNYTEELYIAYCGEHLTPEGEEHFAEALELQIEEIRSDLVIIMVDHEEFTDEEAEHNLKIAKELFESMAGYCDADDWDKWFESQY